MIRPEIPAESTRPLRPTARPVNSLVDRVSRDWKPGEVAYHSHRNSRMVVPATAACSLCSNGDPVYPLVVIDPEDRAQVERLVAAFWANGNDDGDDTLDMQAALRSLDGAKS